MRWLGSESSGKETCLRRSSNTLGTATDKLNKFTWIFKMNITFGRTQLSQPVNPGNCYAVNTSSAN